jgi:hypothetical protein
VVLLLAVSMPVVAQDDAWVPVTGADTLRNFMSGRTAERRLPGGEVSTGEYFADGTGVVREYGASFSRTWEIRGDDQICISSARDHVCYTFERNTADPDLYRGRNVATGIATEFRAEGGDALATETSREAGQGPGAATASADEIAAELANPNTPLASLTFKLQFRGFTGDLPNADNQNNTTLLFQPSIPFPLDNGDTILFRPAIPLLINQPVFDAGDQDFDGETGLGDIAFDLAYARTSDTGILTAVGIISSLPTATNDLGSKRFTLGPEIQLGKLTKQYVLGVFPNHQWDVGGSGDTDISLTTVQVFATYLPGGGWNVGSVPIMTYDHNTNDWTIPINFQFGKTIIAGGRPWKLAMELNYYVEQPDPFGPEWMLGLNVTPVVKNRIAGWFK